MPSFVMSIQQCPVLSSTDAAYFAPESSFAGHASLSSRFVLQSSIVGLFLVALILHLMTWTQSVGHSDVKAVLTATRAQRFALVQMQRPEIRPTAAEPTQPSSPAVEEGLHVMGWLIHTAPSTFVSASLHYVLCSAWVGVLWAAALLCCGRFRPKAASKATVPPLALCAISGAPERFVVQCRVYNLDRYGFIPIANKLLRKEVDGAWHVAISAYGCEYWFDHRVQRQDLRTLQFVRGFSPKYVYSLGTTDKTQSTFEQWLQDVMEPEYNINKYDCFQHNCHHFANDVALYLTEQGIPRWCIDNGEEALSAVVASGIPISLDGPDLPSCSFLL